MHKNLYLSRAALLVCFIVASMAGFTQTQVTITASSGTAGPTNYSTLGAAFAKINDGTHKGDIVIKINANTTETAVAALNASGSGSASYNSINIYPTSTGFNRHSAG
jgi:type II secretory pathway component HofQ